MGELRAFKIFCGGDWSKDFSLKSAVAKRFFAFCLKTFIDYMLLKFYFITSLPKFLMSKRQDASRELLLHTLMSQCHYVDVQYITTHHALPCFVDL